MEKRKFKKVFSKAFIVALAAVAVSSVNVNAETVRETAGKEITDGSYIIGITRFTNDINITADRVLMASQDDVFFKGIVGYKKPAIYQYQLGQWVKYDTNNNPSLATDAEVAMLTEQDIYYVNNEEKILKVAYNRENAGSNLTFVTDAVGKTIKYENGTMFVPATTKTIEVKNGDVLLETLKKTNTNDNGDFKYVSGESNYYGSISADNIFTKSSDVTINGETINVGGTIAWSSASVNHGVGLDGTVDTKSGHRIGIEITAPNGTTLNDTNKIEVYVNGKTTTTAWNTANTGKNSSFWFTPVVESGKSYTVKVVWDKDSDVEIVQTFTIVVNATLAPKPAGTLAGKTVYEKDEDGNDTSNVLLSASSTNDNLLTFSGKEIAWDGNVIVNIGVNEYYSNNSAFNNAKSVTAYYPNTKIDEFGYEVEDNISVPVTNTYDAKTKTLTISGLNFNDTTIGRKITVKVEWDADYIQEFDVVLDANTPFAFPEVRLENVETLVGYANNKETYATHKVTDGVVTIANTQILWLEGNRVKAKLVPSIAANNTGEGQDKLTTYTAEELKMLTVKVDGKVLGEEVDGKFVADTLADSDKYDFDILVENGNAEHTVEVLWNEKTVVATYKIKLDNVTLAAAQKGTYALDGKVFTADFKNDVIYAYRPTFHNITEEDENGNDVIVGQERDAIPFLYEVNGNAVLMNFNNTKAPVKVEVAGKEVTKLTKEIGGETLTGYPIVVKAGSVTSVKVYWDTVNVQEFKVAPHADNAKFEAAKSGEIYIDSKSADKKYSTSLTFEDEIDWKKNGSTKISIADTKEEDKHGYVLENLKIEAPAGVTPDDVKVTINGGIYSSDENAKNFGKVDASAVNGNVITLDPIVTASSQKFTITVNWNGSFVETYTVNIVNAQLNSNAGTLTAPENKPLDNFNGNIDYVADKGNALELTLSAAVTKVEVLDANATVNDEGIKEARTAEVNSNKFQVFFTDAERTATITVTWENGFKQTYTVNAANATIPTIVMVSGLEKSKENGIDYVVTAKVNDNLGSIVKEVLPNTKALTITSSITDADAKHVVEKENNVYIAKTVGTETLTFAVDGAKTIVVKFVVTNDAVTANSTASFDGDQLKVLTNVSGGTGKTYKVEVAVYELLESGLYSKTPAGEGVAIKNGKGEYETSIVSNSNKALPKKVKVVVTTKDESIKDTALDDLDDSNKNLAVTEVIELPNEVRYTLTFDANGGTPVDSITVEPGAEVKAPTTKKADELTPNGKYTKKYVFDKWYTVDSFKEDGTLVDAPVEFDGSEVAENNSYRAYYTVEYYNADGEQVDENGNVI